MPYDVLKCETSSCHFPIITNFDVLKDLSYKRKILCRLVQVIQLDEDACQKLMLKFSSEVNDDEGCSCTSIFSIGLLRQTVAAFFC
jgi:hypothetical protein